MLSFQYIYNLLNFLPEGSSIRPVLSFVMFGSVMGRGSGRTMRHGSYLGSSRRLYDAGRPFCTLETAK